MTYLQKNPQTLRLKLKKKSRIVLCAKAGPWEGQVFPRTRKFQDP